ncbi:MAG TPA: hypothetical protein VEX86_28680 [Longimicrobium sp.]|nr:hypothetical protein [Longimicrobium sp.]
MTDFSVGAPLNGTKLRIIRFAMLAGLLMFAGVAYYIRSNQPADMPPPASDLAAIRYVAFGMCALALVATWVLRGVRQRAALDKRGTLGLIGTAFGEAAALLGIVYYFIGGDDFLPFAVGLLVFLLSWSLLPADPEVV